MKNKKIIIIITIVILVIILGIVAFLFLQKQEKQKVSQLMQNYITNINEKNYEAMYEKVASMNMSKEDFIARNQNIYEGIDGTNLQIEIQEITKKDRKYQITYHQTMVTSAGEVEFNNQANVVKEENDFKIQWSSSLIFPQLGESDKVRVSSISAKRGSILDRNGEVLAQDRKDCVCRVGSWKIRRTKRRSN